LVRLAELNGRYTIQQVGVRFGELNCLVPVSGLDHRLALLQPQINSVTSRGKIFRQLGRNGRVVGLLHHVRDSAYQSLDIKKGHSGGKVS
jgi:hypothetical protein